MHIKFARIAIPHMALPRIVIGSHKEEKEYHDGIYDRDHESHSIMGRIDERIKEPPSTWAAYHGKPGGMMAIVEMEYKELMDAKKEGDHHSVKKELTDLAAACALALKKIDVM